MNAKNNVSSIMERKGEAPSPVRTLWTNIKWQTFLCLMIAMFLTIPVIVRGGEINIEGLNYLLSDNGTATVIGKTDATPRVKIPETVSDSGRNYTVTAIGAEAFSRGSTVESVEIPASVITLGNKAFYQCSNIVSVTFAKGSKLQTIGETSFYGCRNLTAIELPDNVEVIENFTFDYCYNLKSVKLNNGLKKIGNYAFDYCTNLTEIEFPESVVEVFGAFMHCENLKKVTLNKGLKKLGGETFFSCSGLSSIDIPENVAEIDCNVFMNCSSLAKVSLHNGLDTIQANAFRGCVNLTTITIPETVTFIDDWAFEACTNLSEVICLGDWFYESFRGEVFKDCNNLSQIYYIFGKKGWVEGDIWNQKPTYPLEVEEPVVGEKFKIDDMEYEITEVDNSYEVSLISFWSFDMDKPITIPEKVKYKRIDFVVTSIAESVFSGLYELKTVNIQAKLTEIPNYAFYGCICLESVTLPEGLKRIGEGAFENNNSLKTIAIPASVATIGYSAFYGCTNLEEVIFGKASKLEIIGEWAFCSCECLKTITIPVSVTTIGYCAFDWCTNLEEVIFDEASKLEIIDERTFYSCECLKTITIPASVTTIGYCAFDWCTNLEEVIFDEASKLEIIDEWAFCSCECLKTITIPVSVTTIGYCAFGWSGLKSVRIPAGLTQMGGSVFAGCNKLKELTVDPNNSAYCSKDNVIYNKKMTAIISHPTCAGSYAIPAGITEIGPGAFDTCKELVSVQVPDTVQTIGDEAFWDCDSLTSVNLPESMIAMGDSVFYHCFNLESARIPAGLTQMGGSVFAGCNKLKELTVDPNNSAYCSKDNVIYNKKMTAIISHPTCTGSYAIPAGITEIGPGAFDRCMELVSVQVPDTVQTIGDKAFSYCMELSEVIFHGNQPGEGENVFDDCLALEKIYFEKGKKGWVDGGTWNGILTVAMDAPDKPVIDVKKSGNKLILTFTGVLETGTDGKNWKTLDAVSPYTIETVGEKKFFRSTLP